MVEEDGSFAGEHSSVKRVVHDEEYIHIIRERGRSDE